MQPFVRVHAVRLLFAFATVATATTARGQTTTFAHPVTPGSLAPPALEWRAPTGCPSREDLLAEIERLIGRPATSHDVPADRARIAVRRDPRGRWHLRVEIVHTGASARRALVSSTCRHAMSAAALVVALGIDESAREVRASTTGGQIPQTLAVVDDEVPPPVILGDGAPVPPRPRPRRLEVGVLIRLSGGVVFGVLPAPTPGATVVSAVRFGALELQVRAGGVVAQRTIDRPVMGVGGQISLVTLGGRACLGADIGALRLSGCGGADGGWMRGIGVGNSDSRSADGTWVGVAVGPAIEWRPFRGFSVDLAGEAIAVVSAPRFEINATPAYDPPPIGGSVTLGASLHFP